MNSAFNNTPTPYHITGRDGHGNVGIAADLTSGSRLNGGYVIATMYGPDQLENAKFLVNAANCHADLLEVLKQCRGFLESSESYTPEYYLYQDIKKIIAKAEGGLKP